MARAIWKGSISFGLVNIPVGLYSAENRQDTVSFHQLDKRDMSRVRYKRVSESTGKEIPWDNIVRGYEYEEGKYVVLSDEDLQRASPEKTQTVDIIDFVDLEEIDPRYFDKPYYLAPDKRGAKSYALLRETLRRTRKIGIATVVIRSKQYLAAVTVHEDVIVLEILRYAQELRDYSDLDLPRGDEGVSERELDMAERLVEGMVSGWDPEAYHDTYQEDLKAMIERRVKAGQTEEGAEPAEEAPKPARGQVVDLMALLKRSVEEGGGSEGKTAAKKAPARKSAPAKKTAAKKAAPAKKAPAKKAPAKKAAAKKSSSSGSHRKSA